MKIKNGLELLVARPPEEQIDLNQFEAKHNILLPPVYKAFAKAYRLEADNTITSPFAFYFQRQDMVRNFGKGKHINEDVLLGAFYEPSKSIELMFNFYAENDSIWHENLFLVGTNDMNHSILVGVGINNQDKIVIDRFDLEPRFIEVADNIFDLIRGFNIQAHERMLYGPKLSQLYQNWDEDFWRVRENS